MVRLQIVLDIGQQAGGFIAGRLDHSNVELVKCGGHEVIPTGLVTGLRELFQNDEVTDGLDTHQTTVRDKKTNILKNNV